MSAGPWRWTQDDAGQWFLSPGILIAEGTDGTPGGDEFDVANASKIAAAPEMFALLHKLAVMVNRGELTGETTEAVNALGECDELVAKARGAGTDEIKRLALKAQEVVR